MKIGKDFEQWLKDQSPGYLSLLYDVYQASARPGCYYEVKLITASPITDAELEAFAEHMESVKTLADPWPSQ